MYMALGFPNNQPFLPVLMAVLLFAYGCFMLMSLIGLYLYHLSLIAINQTTNEHVKGVYSETENPYDKGCCINYYTLCCVEARPPSKLRDMGELVDSSDFSSRIFDRSESSKSSHASAVPANSINGDLAEPLMQQQGDS